MSENTINLTLRVWRQKDSEDKGRFETYQADCISTDMSFLEMLDVVNEKLLLEGKEPIAFEHDCREGICGSCGAVVTCATSETEKPWSSNPSGPGHSRSSRISSWTAVLWTGSSKPAVTFPLTRAALPRRTPFLCPHKPPSWPWMRRPASVAARALPRAPMHRPCSSWGPRSLT